MESGSLYGGFCSRAPQPQCSLAFVVGVCPVHLKLFSSIPSLYALDATVNSLPQNSDNRKCVWILPYVSWVAKLSWLKTTGEAGQNSYFVINIYNLTFKTMYLYHYDTINTNLM